MVDWWEVPGRDEFWKEEMVNTLSGGAVEFAQEYGCDFLGSSKTLIDIDTLKLLQSRLGEPIERDKFIAGTKVYSEPKENHRYVLSADAAKDGQDNYCIQVIDITTLPFKQVLSGKFQVSHLNMPEVLNNIGTHYNNAFMIIENNEGAGQSNVDVLRIVYEYDNIFKEQKSYYGFRTTSKTRPKILSVMKKFLEKGHLVINDKDTLDEMFMFIEINGKYQADKGYKDDLVMSLAISFAPYLNLNNVDDYREFLKLIEETKETQEQEDSEALLFLTCGYFDDSLDQNSNNNYSTDWSYQGFDDTFGNDYTRYNNNTDPWDQ
jgi:hypothetical protein